jgi:hypothetical protein
VMPVRLHLGPLPKDLRVEVGEPLQDVTLGLTHVTVSQGSNGPDFMPHVTLELALVAVEVEGAAEVEVILPENTQAALVALGWTPPRAVPGVYAAINVGELDLAGAAERISAIVQAACAYVEAPTAFDPDVEDQSPAETAYEDLVAAVNAHKTLAKEMNGES